MPSHDPDQITKYEQETWERCASLYADGFGALVGESIPSLLDAAGVTAGTKVLDIGTGPGLVAAAACDRQGVATGIDFSESMLREARRRYPEIEFRIANAESLPFDDAEFDAVVSNFVLHHVARPEKVLGEARRVLRDGGKIAMTVWSDRSKLEGFGLFLAAIEEHANPEELPHGPLFGVADFSTLDNMLRTAGLNDTSVTNLDVTWRIASINAFLEVFSAWAGMDAYPQTVREAIERSVRERAAALAPDGNLTLSNPAILLCGSK